MEQNERIKFGIGYAKTMLIAILLCVLMYSLGDRISLFNYLYIAVAVVVFVSLIGYLIAYLIGRYVFGILSLFIPAMCSLIVGLVLLTKFVIPHDTVRFIGGRLLNLDLLYVCCSAFLFLSAFLHAKIWKRVIGIE